MPTQASLAELLPAAEHAAVKAEATVSVRLPQWTGAERLASDLMKLGDRSFDHAATLSLAHVG